MRSARSWQRWKAARNRDLPIIDSIQTVFNETLDSAPGTAAQVRATGHELVNTLSAWALQCFWWVMSPRTVQIAGPRVLEHMVDMVLYFEGGLVTISASCVR